MSEILLISLAFFTALIPKKETRLRYIRYSKKESDFRIKNIRLLNNQQNQDSKSLCWNLIWEEYNIINQECFLKKSNFSLNKYFKENPDIFNTFQNITQAEHQISAILV